MANTYVNNTNNIYILLYLSCRWLPVHNHQICLLVRWRDVFYVQHSGFEMFVLADIPSKNRRLKPVPALRLRIESNLPIPLRKTCGERDAPGQKVPQSEAT